jgi:threonine/homoserine/homoserine lactone efflux protein
MRAVVACAIALVFGYVGSMPIAGPIAMLMLARSAQRRFGEARQIGVGAALAEGVYAALAFWGFATFLARQRLIVPLSRAATGALLLALGGWFIRWRPTERRADIPERTAGPLLLGFSVSAVNPTLLVTWSVAVAFLYSKGLAGEPAIVAIAFGASATAGVALWNASLIHLLERYGGRLPKDAMTLVIRVMGLALVGLGLWSCVQLVQWARQPGHAARVHERPAMLTAWRSDPRARMPVERPSRSSSTGATTNA